MKGIIFLSLIILAACDSTEQKSTKTDTLKTTPEKVRVIKEEKPEAVLSKTYSNKRFRDVTAEKMGKDKFSIRGRAQVFEANFSWVVEDGHEELKKGFQMTDAGAPEWGKFEFTIDIQKKRTNSTLTLILFEASPKDGSRQYELPIVLY